ncbi:Ribosomal RNA large subunit methyltransferase H [Folsomia candida]|uniref:Ribosomal RNA large subunit methyltransferase H n=1 Tax=Folsomia candida TaxID=158441 RepID=A0A226DRS6_FOLCA|nr:Ribosomal RNA large subunit methyltransferase H [Folsomia candida]
MGDSIPNDHALPATPTTSSHRVLETSKNQEASPTEKALSNQLILLAIFRYIPSPAPDSPLGTGHLLTFRLVSHAWNDFILSLPTPRVRFHLNPSIPTRVGDVVPIRALTALCANFVSSKLARSIFFQFNSRGPPITSHVRYVFSRFSAEIEFVSVHGMAEVVPFLHDLLIHLRSSIDLPVDLPVVTPSQAWLPVKPKLVTIHSIRVHAKSYFPSRSSAIPSNHHLMQSFLQTVVTAAPNLKEFVIRDAICPSLTHATIKLVKFRFDWYNPRRSDRVRLPFQGLSSLTQLLQAARNSLEELELSATLDYKRQIATLAGSGFTFPPEGMGRLKKFKNWRIDVFKCGESMSRRIVPRLAELVLANDCNTWAVPTVIDADVVQILGVAPGHGHVPSTVTKFYLIGNAIPAYLHVGFEEHIRHVQDLTVEIDKQRVHEGDTFLVEMTSVVVALGISLRLKRVTIISPFPPRLTNLIDCLDMFDISGQPALRNLALNARVAKEYGRIPRFGKYMYFAPNEKERLENVIANLTQRCHVELSNCEFSPAMDQTIRTFVAQNKLDFTLKEGDVHIAPPYFKYDIRGNSVS